jgi:hypothetical protein
MESIEIIPIAIPENHYNQHIANLVKTLLDIDTKLFENNGPMIPPEAT